MKFILNEKYILNEAKFILAERFILTEAPATTADITSTINAIETKLTKYTIINTLFEKIKTNKLTNKTKKNFANLKKLATDVNNSIKAKAGDDALIAQITSYFTVLRNTFKAEKVNLNEFPEIKAIFDDVEEFSKADTPKLADFLNAFNKLVTKIDSLIDALLQDTQSEKDLSFLKQIFTDCNENTQELTLKLKDIKNIKFNPQKDSSLIGFYYNILTKLNEALPDTIYDTINFTVNKGKANEKEDFEVDGSEISQIAKNINNINRAIINFNKAYAHKDDPNNTIRNNIANSTLRDWHTYIDSAADKNAAWTEYFKAEWKENADRVKALGPAVTTELQELGFTEKANPFITFLKRYFITNKLPINRDTYIVLHNAYADKLIDKNILLNENPNNIILNPNLYSAGSGVIKRYLKLQDTIIKEFSKRDPELRVSTAYPKDDSYWRLITDALVEGGDPFTQTRATPGMPLKNINAATEVVKQCFPDTDITDADKKEVALDDIQTWLKKIKEDAIPTEEVIGYLWSLFHLTYPKVFENNQSLIDKAKIPDIKKFKKLDEIFTPNKNNITDKTLTTLLAELAKEASAAEKSEGTTK